MNSYLLFDVSDAKEKMEGIDRLIAIQDNIAADHIVEEVERKTFPYVPLRLGYLEGGFSSKQVSVYPTIQIDMIYSAIANNYYDYAQRQHEEEFTHIRKGTDHYMLKGTREVNAEAIYAHHISKVL
jgi:hypothetical protein